MKISKKKTVFFKYSVVDAHGSVLEQSDIPVGYVHGVANNMFPKIEKSLSGKKLGDEVIIELKPSEHFGSHDSKKTFVDDIANAPQQFQKIGTEVEFQNEQGETIKMRVVKIADGKIYLDGNHPFAGKTVSYKVTVTDIKDATESEIKTGHPVQNHPLL